MLCEWLLSIHQRLQTVCHLFECACFNGCLNTFEVMFTIKPQSFIKLAALQVCPNFSPLDVILRNLYDLLGNRYLIILSFRHKNYRFFIEEALIGSVRVEEDYSVFERERLLLVNLKCTYLRGRGCCY